MRPVFRALFVAGLALAGAILAGCSVGSADPVEPSPTAVARQELPTPTPRTMWFEPQLDPDSGEPSALVEVADAIFIGTVVDAGEGFYRGPLREFVTTWTPYQVDVEDVLLGDVEGEVTVAQMGGLDPEEPIRLVVLVDTPESMEEIAPLEFGATYLFAVETGDPSDPTEADIHFAEPAVGHILVEDEAHREQLIEDFTEAIDAQGAGS